MIYNEQTNQILSCTNTDKYQAMLMPTRSHNWSASNKQGYKTPVMGEDQWHVDYNYNAY